MKKSVYLDTTIPSYYFDKRESVKFQSHITQKWFQEEAKRYQIFLSEITLNELKTGNYPEKEKILDFAIQFELLPNDDEIIKIAEIYIQNYIMPKDFEGDAMHLSFASYYKIDFLLTWNCSHPDYRDKIQHIRILNTRLNLKIPDIITPLQLFS